MDEVSHKLEFDELILDWSNVTASYAHETDGGNGAYQGFVETLFHLSLLNFRQYCREDSDRGSSRSRIVSLTESLQRLYLWGDTFDTGDLDRALDQDHDLKHTVIKQLAHIGKVILHGENEDGSWLTLQKDKPFVQLCL